MVVIFCIVAANAFASLPQAVMEAPPVNVRHFTQPLNSGAARQHPTGTSAEPWAGLERLTFEERLNSDVQLTSMKPLSEAATVELSAIEQLWNSGQYNAALARFRDIGRVADPSGLFVGVNWRRPVSTAGTADWGPNVRIGNQDSVFCTAFDRCYDNGNLLVGTLRHNGANTSINVNLSTDGGATWTETFDGSSTSSPTDLEGVCCGASFFLTYPFPATNMVICLKFDAANGQRIQFPSGAWADTVFATAPAQVTELAMSSADELWPGVRVYTFARTDGDSLLYAWSDGTGQPWSRVSTTVNWCTGGMIDCGYNPGYTTGNWLWASFMYKRTVDTLYPAFAYIDDTSSSWHANWISNLPTTMNPAVTSLAAWHDTILIAYTHRGGGQFYTRALVSNNGGAGWFYTNVPDALVYRELPDVTGTHGEGFALVHREYGLDRAIMYTHSGYDATSWTPQDSVSDHSPNWTEHPRVQWVASGTYGVVYLVWDTLTHNSVWFNRTDWSGIAEKRPVQPIRFGLQAQALPGGTRLAFTNPVAGNVQLRVFDTTGRMVESRQTFLGVGAQTLGFSTSIAGVYFAEVEAAGRASVAKFFVSR